MTETVNRQREMTVFLQNSRVEDCYERTILQNRLSENRIGVRISNTNPVTCKERFASAYYTAKWKGAPAKAKVNAAQGIPEMIEFDR